MADLQPAEAPANGAPPPETLAPAAPVPGAKRQRRPSVRLGDIGEQPAAIPKDSNEPYVRRSKQWRFSSQPLLQPQREPPSAAGGGGVGKVPFRMRPLTNLVSEDSHDALEIPVVAEDKGFHPGEESFEVGVGVRRGGREGKAKRGVGPAARRIRTNWTSRMDEGVEAAELKSSGEDAGDEGFREYDDLRPEESESPMKEYSPSERRAARARAGESREVIAAEATDVDMPVERDGREWSRGQFHPVDDGGVRAWLSGLGLGRYAPVFEIHEVDDEVLPLLTLEDLKDMGINAVGSRRKMYCAIQKLRKRVSSSF